MTGRRLFISYGHDEHAPFAFRLVDALEARNCACWIDRNALSVGRDWTAEIELGIKSSDALVLLQSIRQRYADWCATPTGGERLPDHQIGAALAELFDDAGIEIEERRDHLVAVGISQKERAALLAVEKAA
jgi:hypothetical protein